MPGSSTHTPTTCSLLGASPKPCSGSCTRRTRTTRARTDAAVRLAELTGEPVPDDVDDMAFGAEDAPCGERILSQPPETGEAPDTTDTARPASAGTGASGRMADGPDPSIADAVPTGEPLRAAGTGRHRMMRDRARTGEPDPAGPATGPSTDDRAAAPDE